MILARWLRVVRHRLQSIGRPSDLDAALDRELAFHVEQLTREKIADGLSPDEARMAARREFGNVALVAERSRDQRRVNWLHDARQDVVYGARLLRRQPGFTAVVVTSLAIGIGANAAVMGAIDRTLIQRLPLPDPDRLVQIRTAPLQNPAQLSNAASSDYLAWKERSTAFEAIEASIGGDRTIGADANGAPTDRLPSHAVTLGWFDVLGAKPERGRTFRRSDSPYANAVPVVVISHRLWQSRFGGDPEIVGRTVLIENVARTIVGVMPPDFRYQASRIDCWLPTEVGGGSGSPSRFFSVVARLKPGVTLAQAQGELDAIASNLAKEMPDRNAGWGVRARPLAEALFEWSREPLLTLQAAVALLLFVACANVAGLLLSRSTTRQREIGLRLALGAGRGRIVRQLLTESVLLSAIGGAIGLAVASWGFHGLMAMSPPLSSPTLPDLAVNWRVVAQTVALSVVAALIFGLIPARRMAAATTSEPRPLGALVAAQVALALMVLIGAGLLANSLVRLAWRDLNFQTGGIVTFDVRVPVSQFAHPIGQHRGLQYFDINPAPSLKLADMYSRLRAMPGVESAAGISYVPVNSLILPTVEVRTSGGAVPDPPTTVFFLVTPHFFSTIRSPILRGREVADTDTVSTPWVAVVNETMARKFWPNEDPIGQRFTLDTVPEEQPREVVGLVRDIPLRSNDTAVQPVIYVSYLQQPSRYRAPWANLFGQMTFILRRDADPLALIPAARQAIAEVDPGQPLGNVATMDERLDAARRKFEYYVFLVGLFAITAMALAAIGTYGVMAHAVNQRVREIGIRLALGADARDIVGLVSRRAAAMVLAGLAVGFAGSLALTHLLRSQLWGITPTDPLTFLAVTALLVLVVAGACIVPTRRALRVDPAATLKTE